MTIANTSCAQGFHFTRIETWKLPVLHWLICSTNQCLFKKLLPGSMSSKRSSYTYNHFLFVTQRKWVVHPTVTKIINFLQSVRAYCSAPLFVYVLTMMFPFIVYRIYWKKKKQLNNFIETICGTSLSYFVCLVLWLLLCQKLPLGVGNLTACKHTGEKGKEACQLKMRDAPGRCHQS